MIGLVFQSLYLRLSLLKSSCNIRLARGFGVLAVCFVSSHV